MNNTEFVTVNDNEDLWLIDWTEGIAKLREDITLEDLEINNYEYTDLMEHSIDQYIESKGYIINDDYMTETEIQFSMD